MPADLKEKIAQAAEAVIPKSSKSKTVLVILGAIVGAALICAVAVFSYARKYNDLVYPGVYLGSYRLGGMTGDEVNKFTDNLNGRLDKEGVSYAFKTESGERKIAINTVVIESDAAVELVKLSSEDFDQKVLSVGRQNSGLKHYLDPLRLIVRPEHLTLPIVVDEDNFGGALGSELAAYEKQPKNAGIKITSINPVKYEVTAAQIGLVFDKTKIIEETKNRLAVLDLEPIIIEQKLVMPSIESALLNDLEEKISRVLEYGDIILTYSDPASGEDRQNHLDKKELADLLAPALNDGGQVQLLLDQEKGKKYLDNLRYAVDQPAEESKFVMADGKVQEFRGGTTGRALNLDKSFEAINVLLARRNAGEADVTSTVPLAIDVAEPQIKLAEVNNFGITEIMGVGLSTFHDSYTNRIKNIAHAVARLNGTIIAPGEEFSAVHYAGPFTAENGYLPEEVIKGKEIKKEIGGGMCQIGTTLFRMAMNSGMPITERTNHSLVVHYYADPVNGNPGTDATLYEPILDFKFLNDTGGYLLLETKIDYKKQQLTFTLWGKPDGRRGYYSHPLVSKWIPAGEPEYIAVTTLKPGVQKCQNAFRGAVASFTYTRFTSSSEKIDRVFTSYYRPLPKICMVGVDQTSCPDLSKCNVSPSVPSTTPAETPAVIPPAATTTE